MPLTTVQGKVSGYRSDTTLSSIDMSTTNASVNVKRTSTFRIGNRQVSAKFQPNLMDGDLVTAAGVDGPELSLKAVRNETTHVIYFEPHISPRNCYLLMAAPLTFWLLPSELFWGLLLTTGWLFPLVGYYSLRKGQPARNAVSLVEALPRATE